MSTDEMYEDHPGVRLPPPLIVLAGLVAGMALDGRLTELRLNPRPLVALGILCAAGGLLLGFSALGLFHRKGTKPEPWKPSSSLVTSGVYRFTRNPMYLGMLLLYTGFALIGAGPWSIGLLAVVFLIPQLLRRRPRRGISQASVRRSLLQLPSAGETVVMKRGSPVRFPPKDISNLV